jgi:EmrB/QacA subfamily drug resistance transporter
MCKATVSCLYMSVNPSPTERTSWSTLVLLAVAQFMVILDITVVNVALPTIGSDLGFAPSDLQWVVTAYVLFTGGLLLLGGRAADMLGVRRVFLAGLAVFTAGSLGSGLADSPALLIAMRAVQGLGGALLTPAALSLITTTYAGAQRTTALTVWGVIGSAGAAIGLLVGGMFTTWLSWEWIFLVNVPIGIATALLTLRVVSADGERPTRGGLDVAGAVAVVAGLVTLVYALEGVPDHGWGAPRTLALVAVAGALLATFIAVERSARTPLVPPATWGEHRLIASAAVMFGTTGLLVGTFFLNTIYLQHVLGASALETGLRFVPLALAIAAAAHAASHLLAHAGSRVVVVTGMALIAAGALVLSAAPDDARYAAHILPGLIAIGLGVGLAFPAASVTAMSEVAPEHAGLASGLMMTAHEVGAAVGVAVLAAVATGAAGGDAADGFAAGYGDGFLAAAAIASAMLVAAWRVVPSARPPAPAHGAIH